MKQYKINDVTITQEQIKKLLKENPELKEEKRGRWKPEIDEKYWYVGDEGYILSCNWFNANVDSFKWRFKNCFKTKLEAIKALERIEAINTVTLAIEEANEGWIPDWEDNSGKFYIYYNHEEHCFETDYSFVQDCLILPCMKSKKIADQIVKDYEEELKIIFEI